MVRTLRVGLATALISLPLSFAATAAAQTCPVLDPGCAVDQVIDGGHDAAGQVPDDIDETADTAQGTVDDAQRTVDDTVSTVRDAVDDVLGNGDDPPGGGGGNGGNNGGGDDGVGGSGGHYAHDGTATNADSSGRDGGQLGHPTIVSAASGTAPVALAPRTDLSHPTDRGSSPFERVVTVVISGMAVMALLLAAVGAFLSIQNRLDRRDPKLVAATVEEDRVRFS